MFQHKTPLLVCVSILGLWTSLEPQETSRTLDSGTRDQVLDATVRALQANYVFPGTAEQMAADVAKRRSLGEYDKIDSPSVLAATLTRQLRDISKDLHLSVRWSPDPLPDFDAPPSPERIEGMLADGRRQNFGFEKIERLPGNIGYLELVGFAEGEEAFAKASAAMTLLADCDALIVDLRENGGGSPAMVAYLTTYLFGREQVHLNSLEEPRRDFAKQWWTLPTVPGPRFGPDKPVFVLTSHSTFSAAEEFSYNLQCRNRAVIVGATTGGGAHPIDSVRLTDHFGMSMPFARAVNPLSGTNWEGTGVAADIEIEPAKALVAARVEALTRLIEGGGDPQRVEEWTRLRSEVELQLVD
jgi:hypothetical protein